MKHIFAVNNNSLIPYNNSSVAWINKQKPGTVISADVKSDRNLKLHRKYWALCNLVSQNSEVYTSPEMVSDICKLKLGLVDYRIVVNGEVIIKTKSISFDKMPQEDFDIFYKQALNVMSELSGIGTYELENNWAEYEIEVRE